MRRKTRPLETKREARNSISSLTLRRLISKNQYGHLIQEIPMKLEIC
jgi:hypothetical protein